MHEAAAYRSRCSVWVKKAVVSDDSDRSQDWSGFSTPMCYPSLRKKKYSLRLTKRALINKNFEGFSQIDSHSKLAWSSVAVVDGSVIVENGNATPLVQHLILARLHRSLVDQLAMVDAAKKSGGLVCIVIVFKFARVSALPKNLVRI